MSDNNMTLKDEIILTLAAYAELLRDEAADGWVRGGTEYATNCDAQAADVESLVVRARREL